MADDPKMHSTTSTKPLRRVAPYVAVLALGLCLLGFVQWRQASETDAARQTYITEAHTFQIEAASKVGDNFTHIYQNLRTIARLPGVRSIDRYARNFDANARRSVQEIYNNLAQNVAVSEVYVVPVDFDPDKIDPNTGKLQAPIIQFDQLITGRNAEASDDADEDKRSGQGSSLGLRSTIEDEGSVEEIEIYEYRFMRQQLARFKTSFGDESKIKGLAYPALSSPSLITCDNTRYSPKQGDDHARMGIVYSTPFYDENGQLKGMISAVMLTAVVGEMLPRGSFAVHNRANDFVAPSVGFADWREWDKSIRAGRPDTSRIFSSVVPVEVPGENGWSLWAAGSDKDFWARGDVATAHDSGRVASLLVIALTGMLLLVVRVLQRNDDHKRLKNLELEQRVRERTAALHESMKSAESANRAKSEFLAMMSHEIRTPMNGVLGMTGVLLDSQLSPEQRRSASTIRESAESLLGIINDVLDFSKLEAQAMEFERVAFDIYALLTYAKEIVAPRANAKAIDLKVAFEGNIPQFVRADPGRIRQIVLNLLGNAVKFTERGSVTLKLSAIPGTGAAGEVRLRFEVIDSGIGIPAERLDRLFQSFSQTDASMSRRFGGTGLGLAISKKLTERMGGTIGVDSVAGKGSTFWFELPVAPASAAEAEASTRGIDAAQVDAALEAIAAVGRPLRLLVAEDNATNQLVAKSVLAKFGIVPDFVGNGLEAIEAVRRRPYDIVLMDVHMPEMDGLQATKAIRAFDSARARVPIVALTANAFAHDIEECRIAGMNAHVGKPFRTEELLVALGDALKGQSRFVEPAPQPAIDVTDAPVLDWDTIERFRADSGEDMLHLLLDTYLADTAEKLDQLANLAGNKNSTTEAIRLAHSLKSASAMAGAAALAKLAATLEGKLGIGGGQLEAMDSDDLAKAFKNYRGALNSRGLVAA